MVEWNINHRMMADKVNSSISNYDFEGLAKWFNSLPEEYQKILVEECDKAGLETSYSMEEEIPDYRRRAEEKGMTIIPTEEINIEAFEEAGKAAYEVLGIADVREQILKELAAMQ